MAPAVRIQPQFLLKIHKLSAVWGPHTAEAHIIPPHLSGMANAYFPISHSSSLLEITNRSQPKWRRHAPTSMVLLKLSPWAPQGKPDSSYQSPRIPDARTPRSPGLWRSPRRLPGIWLPRIWLLRSSDLRPVYRQELMSIIDKFSPACLAVSWHWVTTWKSVPLSVPVPFGIHPF